MVGCWEACWSQKADAGRRSSPEMQKRIEEHRSKLEAYEGFCREMGEQPADVALAWLLKNPVVTAPIIGPRTAEQLAGSLRATELKLSADQLESAGSHLPRPWWGCSGSVRVVGSLSWLAGIAREELHPTLHVDPAGAIRCHACVSGSVAPTDWRMIG